MSGSLPVKTPFTRSGTSVLPPNQYMSIGQELVSPNGRYKLILQPDANLVLYDGDIATWVANGSQPYSFDTYNRRYAQTRFYVSNSVFLEDSQRSRIWTASTGRTEEGLWYRSHLVVQDDGNLVTLDVQALYTTLKTTLLPNSEDVAIIPPNTALEMGKAYTVGDYSLIFQVDGNLVVYGANGVVMWNSGTYGKGATEAVMQADGNFVIYNAQGVALWSTGTYGHPGAYAQIQKNGAFVICSGTLLWARFGWAPGKLPNVFYPDNGKWNTYNQVIYSF